MDDSLKNSLNDEVYEKLTRLRDYIRDLGSLAIGFSSGVDSTLLLAVAAEELGDKALALTGEAVSVPEWELNEAVAFCEERGIKHILCKVDVMQVEGFRMNSPDRCYHCKKMIFSELKKLAAENGIEYVAEGSNMDDLGDYRPGMKAIAELDIKSPLREVGLYKSEIRQISEAMGLPTWNKPAYACLASRFVYGEEITDEKVHMIERAEHFLIEQGFAQERVRLHGNLARIEVPPEDISRIASEEIRERIYKEFESIGFQFITLDMKGYSMGSMNQTIT